MRWGWIGGLLVIGGSLLLLPAFAVLGAAGLADGELRDLGNLVLGASGALLASGVGALCVFGPKPFDGRAIRIAFGVLAVGTLAPLLVLPLEPSPASDWVMQLLSAALDAIGSLGSLLGMLMLGVGLARTRGPSRVVGWLFLGGLLLIPLGFVLAASGLLQFTVVPFVLGYIGVGALAIRGDRSARGVAVDRP